MSIISPLPDPQPLGEGLGEGIKTSPWTVKFDDNDAWIGGNSAREFPLAESKEGSQDDTRT
jgi:hypothetical protein